MDDRLKSGLFHRVFSKDFGESLTIKFEDEKKQTRQKLLKATKVSVDAENVERIDKKDRLHSASPTNITK